jgi:alpha-glucosidase
MYFRKFHHPVNCVFPEKFDAKTGRLTIGGRSYAADLRDLGDDVFRLTVRNPAWPKQYSQAELTPPQGGASRARVTLSRGGDLVVADDSGKPLLKSVAGHVMGVCGKVWIMPFEPQPDMQFYGMGEKSLGLELSRVRTKFWNTDVWADFATDVFTNGRPDPMYVSVPYLIVKRQNTYLGILINNPYAVFMSTDARTVIANQMAAPTSMNFYIGAPDGLPELYFIVGPTLHELTCKLQKLVGVTPLPPLWALGHHQCRWGYKGTRDLRELDREFRKQQIPTDGLWLDIDYMDGYRVFTFSKEHFKDPKTEIMDLRSRGRHIMPILDPGVKLDSNYAIYKDGLKAGAFCINPEKRPFVGFVWPGATVFPDYSTETGRAWWAKHVASFAKTGVSGAWLDMNDPAVGMAELDEMRFNNGKEDHATYHSQYALGMARASRDGFLKASPNERPFLLCRSGFISSSRYTAIWTGDNVSNWHHLKTSIPTSVNLALSGIPFNGPDVPGFGGSASKDLAVAWYKAAFLFPVLRNHSIAGSARQEPWVWGKPTMEIIRHYIRLRYKLLPYLYNLWIDQEELGAAILRPLFYDFNDSPKLPLGKIADQFMVGGAIMHAPVIEPKTDSRTVVLPKATWFDTATGQYIQGGREIRVTQTRNSTPLYVREGSVIPMLVGTPTDNASDLSDIEVHVFARPQSKAPMRLVYRFDDGRTFDYQKGERSEIEIDFRIRGRTLIAKVTRTRFDYKPCRVRFVTYGAFDEIELIAAGGAPRKLPLSDAGWIFTGARLATRNSAPVTLEP